MGEYKSREFCRAECDFQKIIDKYDLRSKEKSCLKGFCKRDCVKSADEFIYWLQEKGYEFIGERNRKIHPDSIIKNLGSLSAYEFHDILQKKQIRIIQY